MRHRCCPDHESEMTDFMVHVVQMLHRIEGREIMTQASVDAATAAIQGLGTEVDQIDAEIETLKSQGVDTTALEAATAGLKTKLDQALSDGAPADTSAPAPTDGGDTSAPVETQPSDPAQVSQIVGSDAPTITE